MPLPKCSYQLLIICLLIAGLNTIGHCTERRVPQDYANIQAAVNACAAGDAVVIANGTYTGTGNRAITFPSISSITIRSTGGSDACIIDCQSQAQAFIMIHPNPGYATIEGLTIRNGLLNGTFYPCYGAGGGICVRSLDVNISECQFENCVGAQYGGGLAIYWSDAIVSNCRFTGNSISPAGNGGGFAAIAGDFAILDCHFEGNSATGYGGGLYAAGGTLGHISRCFFISNYLPVQGIGGAGLGLGETNDLTVSNCVFAGNSAPEGSAIYSLDSTAAIESCTVVYNVLTGASGGLYAEGEERPVLRNCIFYSNGGYEVTGDTGNPAATYCDITLPSGVYPGIGNINADPKMAYGPEGEYYINQSSSPCINTGSSPASQVCFETMAGTFCQNAYSTAASGAFDTGIVDMGCHFVSTLPTPTPFHTATPSPFPTPTYTIPPTATMCVGSNHEKVVLEEHFESWPPAGWTVINNGGDCVWESTGTTGRPNYATGNGYAAIADSRWCGIQGMMNTDLMSPVIDLSSYSEASLDMVVAFQSGESDLFEVKVSTNGGSTWHDEVLLWEEVSHQGYGPGQQVRVVLTPFLSSQTRIKLSYRAQEYRYWVIVDDLFVKVCEPNTTPSATPTRTPTMPPSPTPPPPSATPTTKPGDPTHTPVIPSPTPGCDQLGCEIYMPSNDFGAGDPCYCDVTVCNTGTSTLTDIPVFVILDVYGSYFFAPDFSNFNYYLIPLVPGDTVIHPLPEFQWPQGVSPLSGIKWYAAMTNPGISDLFGEMDMFTFGWH